jgi:hypothetical protein
MRTGVQYARPLTAQGHRGRGADQDERRGGEQVEGGELASLRASRIRRRTPPTADRSAAGSLGEAVAEAAMRGSRAPSQLRDEPLAVWLPDVGASANPVT